jgi:hypothetical protein
LYDLLHLCQRCKSRNPLQIPTQLIHRFYLAFTPQTFFFLLLAAELKPPLRAQLPPIVRADEQLSPLLSRLPDAHRCIILRTPTAASAAKKESCCGVECAGTMRIVRPLLFENSSLPAVEVSRELTSGRSELCARIASGLPLP